MSAANEIVLGDEQQAAITTPGNLVIRAGAGSGKTEVLARRAVAILAGDLGGRSPVGPERIAAITFTEKAALDMRTRIAGVLAARIAIETDAERKKHLQRAALTLARARISTLHAFCARILRENPFAVGLDPDFSVLDESESHTFFTHSCRRTLVEAVRSGDPAALFLVRARRMSGARREGSLEIIERLFSEMRRGGHEPEWLRELTAGAAERLARENDRTAVIAHELVDLIDALLNLHGQLSDGKLDSLRAWWPGARPRVLMLDGAVEASALEVLRELAEVMPDARSPRRAEPVKAIRELVNSSATNFGLAGSLIEAWGERRASDLARRVAELVERAARDFAAAKSAERVVTFDDLLIATRDLLRHAADVAARYRVELAAILVDEYQDTDPVQDEIIELLTSPRAGQPAAPELFIVGDEKQSIYRFRGADVRVFNGLRKAPLTELPLVENRRSTAAILNFANELSASMMAAGSTPPAAFRVVWSAAHALKPSRRAPLEYPVEIILAVEEVEAGGTKSGALRLRAVDKRQLEARVLASRVRAIVAAQEPITDPLNGVTRPAEYRDFAILFRAFTDVAIYERAFVEAGIDCYTVKGRGFFGRREIIDVAELLAAVDDPRDEIALAATLRSPFFGLSDKTLLELGLHLHEGGRVVSIVDLFAGARDFSWLGDQREEGERVFGVLEQLRALRGRAPLLELIERALELTDYESVMAGLAQGRQRVANLRKLMEMARRFDTLHFFSLRDFVVYLRRLIEEEPYEPQAQILGESENVVRLMTVHQAKGLEFPIVILADVGRGPGNKNFPPLLDPAEGLILCETVGSGNDEIPNAALKRCRGRLREEEDAEAVRILYVAITRARDRLIVSEGAGIDGWSKPLRAFIGKQRFVEFAQSGRESAEIKIDSMAICFRRAEAIAAEEGIVAAVGGRGLEAESLALMDRRLAAREADPGELTISATALADFDRCPRQYWLRHGLSLPESHSGAAGRGDAATMGSVAHQVLERLRFASEAPVAAATVARLTSILGAAEELGPEECAIITRDLTRYLETVADERIIGRELPFMLNPAPGLFVRGQIDLLLGGANELTVRDYKYSRHADAGRYALQLECYVLAAATALPNVAIKAEVVALRDGPETVALDLPSIEDIRAGLAALGIALHAASTSGDYPKKPPHPSACRRMGCGYVGRCWKD